MRDVGMSIFSQRVMEEVSTYNEASVRMYIIDPILKKLGYVDGPDVYLRLEEKLGYPYYFIGRKNKDKDLPLGRPDYKAGLKGARGSFITEAKSANVNIEQKDVEQAHSYAAHAEVGANFFVLCNGHKIVVHETLSGPEHRPIVEIPLEQIDARFHELESILHPTNLAKHCHVTYDRGLKLCDGLGSFVEIRDGHYTLEYTNYSVLVGQRDVTNLVRSRPEFVAIDEQLEMMKEFEPHLAGGAAYRDEQGRINARVTFAGVTKNSLEGMKILGIDTMHFSTTDKFVSVDPQTPTIFESELDFTVKEGTIVLPLFGQGMPALADLEGDVFVQLKVHKASEYLTGTYVAVSDYYFPVTNFGPMEFQLGMAGKFVLRVL